MISISLASARAWWAQQQRVGAGVAAESVAALTRDATWPRTLGGADAYLAYHARLPGMTKALVDASVDSGEIVVRPAVRGCMFVVAADQSPLCVRFAASMARRTLERQWEKVEVPPAEQATVRAAVLDALRQGPATTDALRKRLPAGATRSLGELGKKHGVSSTLPPTLRLLEFDGRVRRVTNAGLDAESYDWVLTEGDPYAGLPDEADAVGLLAEITKVFLRHAGPATAEELAWWSGAGKKVVAQVLSAFPRVEVEGRPSFVLPDQLDALAGVRPLAREAVGLISGHDAYVQCREHLGLLVDPAEASRVVGEWSQRSNPLSKANSTESRLIVEAGEVVGQWDWDPTAGEVVWGTWRPRGNPAIGREVARVGAFLRALGHGRVYSLDSDARAAERCRLLRGLSQA